MPKIYSFKAVLEPAREGMDATYVSIPLDVEKIYGTRGQIKVKATFDGHPYRGILAGMGTGGHVIGVRKDIRKAIGKNAGDVVKVTLEQDLDERVVDVPVELRRLLAGNNKALGIYQTLSFTNRKEFALWISSAKKPETKAKRLGQIIPKLLSGKKNPSDK